MMVRVHWMRLFVSPLDAAIREVFEETGLICISDTTHSNPIDIDAHKIPANPRKNEGAH